MSLVFSERELVRL